LGRKRTANICFKSSRRRLAKMVIITLTPGRWFKSDRTNGGGGRSRSYLQTCIPTRKRHL
jgi:hypothetical protein